MSIERGQYLTSQLKLSRRWGWHRETVSKFLRLLEGEKMASIETSTGYTRITIQNYSKYQDAEEGTTDSRTDTRLDNQTTVERQSSGTNNNVKNAKNEKKYGEPSTLQGSLKQLQSPEEEWEDPSPIGKETDHPPSPNARPHSVHSRRAGKTTFPRDFAISEDHREYIRQHKIPIDADL